jgi:hypothetical protein
MQKVVGSNPISRLKQSPAQSLGYVRLNKRDWRLKILVVTGLLMALVGVAPGARAAPPRTPTFFGEADCPRPEPYGGTLSVFGLEPHARYMIQYNGAEGSAFVTDDSGTGRRVGGFASSQPFEITVAIWPDPNGNFTQDPGEPTVLSAHFVVDRPCVAPEPARPASKDQCRNGHWTIYGVFNSQGECVGYVTDLARRKCIFERAAHGLLIFRDKYGVGPNHDYAMRRCVRRYTGV